MRVYSVCSIAGFLFLIATVTGCTRDPVALFERHMRRGNDHAAAKRYPEAVIEYRNAVAAAPNSENARFKLAESYAAQNQLPLALLEYTRAADLNPKFAEAQLKAGNLLLLSRQFADAKARARKILEYEPDHPAALLMLGNAMAGLGQVEEAVAANTRAATLDPKNAGMHLNLGALSYISGDVKQSETAFLRAVASAPESVGAHVALANFYVIVGRSDDAERVANTALKLDASHVAANQLLASIYLASGRSAAAEPLLQKAASVANDVRTKLALADYYIGEKRTDEALALLGKLAGEPRAFASAVGRIALIQLAAGRSADATVTLDAVLKVEPKAAGALALKSHISLANRDVAGARAFAEAAVAADQRSTRALFALAMVEQATGQNDQARKSLLGVLHIDPNAAEAAVELAKIHLARKEIDNAVQFANQAVKAAPRFLDARLIRLRTLIVRPSDAARADAELKTLLTLFPTSSEVQLARAALATSRGQHAIARQAFERAMELNPTDVQALEQMVGIEVRAGRTADARRQVDAALAKSGPSASLLIVAGKAYSADGDNAAAERHFRRAIELDPTMLEAYGALAALYIAGGRLPEAQREFIELAKRQSKKSAPPTMVGILFEAQRDFASAVEWYKKALQIDPRAATAANNLAWLYADRGENLDDAVLLAQAASAALPKQPEVADTLGWVYYKQNLPSMAVPHFERAIQGRSDQPDLSIPFGAGPRQTRPGPKSEGLSPSGIAARSEFSWRCGGQACSREAGVLT